MEENSQPKIRFLSYNVGLLDYHLFGSILVFSNPPHGVKRLPFIPEAIRKENADIVCLQECYNKSHAKLIIDRLVDIYPYNARQKSGGTFKFHNGLLILSKYPILEHYLDRYKHVSDLESWLATKSGLVAVIDVPNVGALCVVNVHTTAGGAEDPETPSVDTMRQSELQQTVNCIDLEGTNNVHGIIIGDYNCGPEASPGNYSFMLEQGFRDLFVESFEASSWSCALDLPHTWDPKNYLNVNGPHRHTPPQRIDHMMVSKRDSFWAAWQVQSSRIVFTEKVVPISKNIASTISDHYGLVIEIFKQDFNSDSSPTATSTC